MLDQGVDEPSDPKPRREVNRGFSYCSGPVCRGREALSDACCGRLLRRTSFERPNDSWALDIVDPETGRLTTLDEKDDWESVLERAYPLVARRA